MPFLQNIWVPRQSAQTLPQPGPALPHCTLPPITHVSRLQRSYLEEGHRPPTPSWLVLTLLVFG